MRLNYIAIKTNPTTLVVHCSDPRFQLAFNCFLTNEPDAVRGQIVPIVVAGGPASLANPMMAKEKEFLSNQIIFFLEHFPSIKLVVLINHEDCGFYRKIPNPTGRKNRERDDALIAAQTVSDRIASEGIEDVEVAAFYAEFANIDKSEITFKKM